MNNFWTLVAAAVVILVLLSLWDRVRERRQAQRRGDDGITVEHYRMVDQARADAQIRLASFQGKSAKGFDAHKVDRVSGVVTKGKLS